ncbi:MAG: DUF1330 domain-containing protein, partial [Myxococcales bacterium]|nr:DUF1330 domain-containing protein [Myxococcales bacterium]
MPSIEPTRAQLEALLALPDEGPIVMINLLRYREQASYAADAGVEPCTGREAYARYGAEALQHLGSVGGRPIWMGQA